MSKKPMILSALLVVAAGIFLYLNRDWFTRRPIQINHRFYAFGGRFDKAGVAPLMFEFDRRLKLTSVKVVSIDGLETNKYPHALWELVSESNSVPTRGFLYGMDIPGMRRVYKGVAAEQLAVDHHYRLLIQAHSLKAQHDFDLEPAMH